MSGERLRQLRRALVWFSTAVSALGCQGQASPSVWARAQEGKVHIQLDLTQALPSAQVGEESADKPQGARTLIQGRARDGIYMPTPCRARFPVFLHHGAVFEAHVALLPAAWSTSTDGAQFLVYVVGSEEEERVLVASVRLNPRSNPAHRGWHPLRVSLAPWSGRVVRLELVTLPGEVGDTYRDWCFWGEPVVYSPPLPRPSLSPEEVHRAIQAQDLQVDWCFVSTRALADPTPVTAAVTLDGSFREGLYAHPPFAVSATLQLGPRARLYASMGMVDRCHTRGDGVLARVRAFPRGGAPVTVFEYWMSPRTNACDRRWVDVEIPLGDLGPGEVTVQLETDPGPAGDLVCDSFVWGFPRIVSVP